MKPDVYTERKLSEAAHALLVRQTLERRSMVTAANMWALWSADAEQLQHFVEREPIE